jgi:hypothetical protein
MQGMTATITPSLHNSSILMGSRTKPPDALSYQQRQQCGQQLRKLCREAVARVAHKRAGSPEQAPQAGQVIQRRPLVAASLDGCYYVRENGIDAGVC